MNFLFDSQGRHLANAVDGQLHAPTGENIGHFVEADGIYVDMLGQYLGEVVLENRLLSKKTSPLRFTNYGELGDFGNAGNFGDPGEAGTIGIPSEYEDVAAFSQ